MTPRTALVAAVAFLLFGGGTAAVRVWTLPPPPPVLTGDGEVRSEPLALATDSLVPDSLSSDSTAISPVAALDSMTEVVARLRSDSAAHALAAEAALMPQPPGPAFPATAADSGFLLLIGQSAAPAAAELLLSLDDSLAAQIILALPTRKGTAILEVLAPDHRGAIGRYMLRLPPLPASPEGPNVDFPGTY